MCEKALSTLCPVLNILNIRCYSHNVDDDEEDMLAGDDAVMRDRILNALRVLAVEIEMLHWVDVPIQVRVP